MSIENTAISFEDFKNENGITYWWASDLAKMVGYLDFKVFEKAITRAIKACITLNIPHYDNFIVAVRTVEGIDRHDYKLTRFACYLSVMNSDSKKPEVAKAQVYFIEQTRKFELLLNKPDDIERVTIRDEIKEGNKSLASIASKAGVIDFAKFTNAGYIGMYNMFSAELARKRRIEPKHLIECMGRSELAANLFRITQTEERIKSQNLQGQTALEFAHKSVGKEVRAIIIKNTGKPPEMLPLESKLPEVHKQLKKGYKNMRLEDNKKKSSKS